MTNSDDPGPNANSFSTSAPYSSIPASGSPNPISTLEVTEWKLTRLDKGMFSDSGERFPPATVANVAYLLERHGVTARYNVIKKKLEVVIPGMMLTAENADNVSMTHIVSLAALNGISTGLVPTSVEAVADGHAYNPIEDWIRSRP